MNFEEQRQEFGKCRKEVFDLLKIVTKETEQEQWYQYNTEPQYHMVVQHLTDVFMTIKTNRYFQEEKERLNADLQQMFKTHSNYNMNERF